MRKRKPFKQSFLVLCNRATEPIINHYKEIFQATSDLGDSLLLYHLSQKQLPKKIKSLSSFHFSEEVLTELNYFPLGFSLIPGSNHFPLLKFYLSHPEYDYYWCIEEDVRFSGNWQTFFESFSHIDSDFISCHLRRPDDEPDWYWWSAMAHPYATIPLDQRIRSFNPIYRISKLALEQINKALLSKWCGHHEVLIPTLLYQSGLEIIDFGGTGEFVPPGFENEFYLENTPNKKGILSDGTMRWRPVFKKAGEIEGKLYHPVK